MEVLQQDSSITFTCKLILKDRRDLPSKSSNLKMRYFFFPRQEHHADYN